MFELVRSRTAVDSHIVRFNDNPLNDVEALVDAGFMTRVNKSGCLPPP